jgi:hypothetical protein
MPDYFALMSRAVAKLDGNTAESRQLLFDRARALVVRQLRNRYPIATEPEIKRELFALEQAIRKVEFELAITLVRSTKPAASLAPSEGVFGRQMWGDRSDTEPLSSADSSTLIHLTTHIWLNRLMTDAMMPTALEGQKRDLDAVLQWLEVEKPEDIGPEQHEQWEWGFKQYLREGKAPSDVLARSFNFFRDRLQGIERSSDPWDKPITDDMRAVYDRMLASDEAIGVFRGDRNPTLVFTPLLRGVLGFVAGFVLMFSVEALLFGGTQFLSLERLRLIGLGWLMMPVAAGGAGWILFRRFELAKVGLTSIFAKFKSWPRQHQIALAISFALGWIIAVVLGYFASIAGRPNYSPPTFAMWILGSSEYFPWASLATGFAGGVVGAAMICVRQLLRSGDASTRADMAALSAWNDDQTTGTLGDDETHDAARL